MPRRAFAEVGRYAMAAALAGRLDRWTGRRCVAAALAAVLWLAGGRTTRAHDVTIAFDSLAAEDGQTITTFSSQGFTVEEVGGMTVVGPSNPAYAGAVGLIPSSGDYVEIYVTPNPGQFGFTTYDLSDITVTFASATGPSNPQNISEYVDAKYYYGMPVAGDIAADWNWQGTVAGPTAFTGSVLADTSQYDQPVSNLFIHDLLGRPTAQILSITLDVDIAPTSSSVPEPSSLLTLALGIGGISLACAARRKEERIRPRRNDELLPGPCNAGVITP